MLRRASCSASQPTTTRAPRPGELDGVHYFFVSHAEFDDLIADTKDGIYMETNRSWSIDDRRLNFQFGTELAREIIESPDGQRNLFLVVMRRDLVAAGEVRTRTHA